MQEFFHMLQYLLAANAIDVVTGDFNYDILKVLENNLVDNLKDHVQMVNESLMDYVYIKKVLMKKFFINATVENIDFSDYDAVRIIIRQNNVDIDTIS